MLGPISDWITVAPLWAIALFIFAGLTGSAWAAFLLRRLRERKQDRLGSSGEESSEQAITVTSVMGLLALLVAFTFSIALERFDTRRDNVLTEANSIGTTYLRAQMLDEPHRTRISNQLADYVDTRNAFAATPPGPKQRELMRLNDQHLAELWTSTVAAFPSMRTIPLSVSFLDTMNALIDMDATRKAGRQAHVPAGVILALFLFQFVAAGLISYVVVGHRSRQTAWVLFGLLGFLMLLIIDVDRPLAGSITELQEPMLQLQAFIHTHPPAAFSGGAAGQ